MSVIKHLKRAKQKYQREGIIALAESIPGFFEWKLRKKGIVVEKYVVLLKLLFAVLIDKLLIFGRGRKNNVVIVPRRNYLTPCNLDLISRCRADQVVIHVQDIDKFTNLNNSVLNHYQINEDQVYEWDSIKSVLNITQAKAHVSVEHPYEMHAAAFADRWFDYNIEIVKIPDGIVTKSVGSAPNKWFSNQSYGKSSHIYPKSENWIRVAQSGVNHYRVAAHSRRYQTDLIRLVGFPRVRRANDLKLEKVEPVVPDSLNKKLNKNSDSIKILIGLTKNQQEGSDIYWLLEQLDITMEQLDETLEQNGVSLWIKEHPNTVDEFDLFDGYKSIASDNIIQIYPKEAPSSVDLIYHMDGLLTDISSIYVDALPFDIPIGFINYEYWKSNDRFSYPESPFYPGEKINTLGQIHNFIEDIEQNSNLWQTEREYARRVLLGEGVDTEFWNNIIDSPE